MLKGVFIRGDGLRVPNNITQSGAAQILAMALRSAPGNFFVGLCSGVFDNDLQIDDVDEPSIGVNGYARIALERSNIDWPVVDDLNGIPFIESKPLIWTAAGGNFDVPVTRMFLCHTLNLGTGDVFALSAALPEELTITPTTDVAERTFKYRLYLR